MNLPMQVYGFLKENPDEDSPFSLTDCLRLAYQQFIYFDGWFNTPADTPSPPPDTGIPESYWHTLKDNPTAAMIEERPIAYPPYFGYDPRGTILSTVPKSLWTGDQGIFVNACAEMYIRGSDFQSLNLEPKQLEYFLTKLKSWLKAVAQGVQTLTFPRSNDQPNGDWVLREAPFSNIFVADQDPYLCGRGVLARFFTWPATMKAWRLLYPSATPPFYWASGATAYVVASPSLLSGEPTQLSPKWNDDNSKNAYNYFIGHWGAGDPSQSWHETGNNAAYNNACQMMGFDVYFSWIQMNPEWALEKKPERPHH
jgi:hypothetical protein